MKIVKALLLIISILISGLFYSCKKTSTKPVPPASTKPPTITTPLPVNVVAYWPLDYNKANDISRYGNNGVKFNTSGAVDRFGNANGAMYFDGATSYIEVPDSIRLRLGDSDFTLNAWVKMDSYDATFESAILSKRIGGYYDGWLWALNGKETTPVGVEYFGGGGGFVVASGTRILSTDTWYMVTCVYSLSDETISMYTNGSFDHNVHLIPSLSNANTANLFIGKDEIGPNNDEYYFHGTMDDISIYNSALSADDITQLYTATN